MISILTIFLLYKRISFRRELAEYVRRTLYYTSSSQAFKVWYCKCPSICKHPTGNYLATRSASLSFTDKSLETPSLLIVTP